MAGAYPTSPLILSPDIAETLDSKYGGGMSDTTPGGMPDPEGLTFGTSERALATVLLIGAMALAYVCLDVIADGRMTAALTRGRKDSS